MGELLEFLFDDDDEEKPKKKSGRAKKPRPGGGSKPPPKKSKTAGNGNNRAGGTGQPQVPQGGTAMQRLQSIAGTATGNTKAKKKKGVIKAFEAVIEATEEEAPGTDVLVIVDGTVIGDVKELVRERYRFISGDNGVALMGDDVNLFIGFCVATIGDNDTVRKEAKSTYEKKGV